MSDKKDFALVRKPSSAVEKAAPRTKRILSGMVADTLALTKEQADKPVTLLFGVESAAEGLFQLLILSGMAKFIYPKGKRYNFKFIRFDKTTELFDLAEQRPFDAIVMWFDNINWNTSAANHSKDNILKATEVLTRLKIEYRKPIIVGASRNKQPADLGERLNKAGIAAFFWIPFEDDGQAFVETLDIYLK